jgi:hypothetical protein
VSEYVVVAERVGDYSIILDIGSAKTNTPPKKFKFHSRYNMVHTKIYKK